MGVDELKLVSKDMSDDERKQYVLDNPVKQKVTMSGSKLQDFLAKDEVKSFQLKLLDKSFNQNSNCKTKFEVLKNRDLFTKEVTEFFTICYQRNIIPTISTLIVYLGLNRETFYSSRREGSCPCYDLVEASIRQCHAINEIATLNNVIDPKLYVFLAKNYYDMTDTQAISISPDLNNVPNNTQTLDALKEQLTIESDEIV